MGHSKTLFAMAILTVALSLMTFALSADSDADPPTTGQCGDDMHWTFYPDQSRLVIEGAGKMYDYDEEDERWGDHLNSPDDSITVEILEGVTTIGDNAFIYCRGMATIIIPEGVDTIGKNAFQFCSNLTSIDIPASLKTIEGSPCLNCYSLESVNVDSGNKYYKSVDGVLFDKDMDALIVYPTARSGEYAIPNDVKTIPDRVFAYSNITKVTIPGSVETISEQSFAYSNHLTTVTICDGTAMIEGQAFYGCEALETATIPDTVLTIGQYAFHGCNSLKNAVIPYSVNTIGDYAFGEIKFYDGTKELSQYDLHGHVFKGENKILKAVPQPIEGYIVSFVDTGGTSLAESMTTGEDGKLSYLPDLE